MLFYLLLFLYFLCILLLEFQSNLTAFCLTVLIAFPFCIIWPFSSLFEQKCWLFRIVYLFFLSKPFTNSLSIVFLIIDFVHIVTLYIFFQYYCLFYFFKTLLYIVDKIFHYYFDYIYIYIERERKRDRNRENERERDTHTHTHSFYLYNFIKILSSFLICVSVSSWNWWMNLPKISRAYSDLS